MIHITKKGKHASEIQIQNFFDPATFENQTYFFKLLVTNVSTSWLSSKSNMIPR